MKTNPKIIAMYLPQFHQIPENDAFWGDGFTDWIPVRKARPLYITHNQPNVPLDNNYYDLSQEQNVIWQSKLAQQYGIYGFGVYHYWFNSQKQVLTKPAEILRDNVQAPMPYFLVWDNASWKRTWSNVAGNDWAPMFENGQPTLNKDGILLEYILGNKEDWKIHYDYLRSHFISPNYIKKGNKPIFVIFNYDDRLDEMAEYWNSLAKDDGFDGIQMIYRYTSKIDLRKDYLCNKGAFLYNYEPMTSAWTTGSITLWYRVVRKIKKILRKVRKDNNYILYSYDMVWKTILRNAKGLNSDRNIIHGAFVSYDDTPRRGYERGKIIYGATPKKFRKYFGKLIEISQIQGKEYIFLTAWNEWGEGAYLEPDAKYEYQYLDAIKNVVESHK